MVDPDGALPGRSTPVLPTPAKHAVLGTSLTGPWPDGAKVIYLGMGCFWGSEEIYWRLPGVISTSVGYMGGYTKNPTYEEVCTGLTGHTEAVMVVYDPAVISTYEILRNFWENHDPTQGYRQGNDTGTQYRGAIYYTDDEQRELIERTRAAYAKVIADRGYGDITTEVLPASGLTYFMAEDYHQQYLYKVPNGYRCTVPPGRRLAIAQFKWWHSEVFGTILEYAKACDHGVVIYYNPMLHQTQAARMYEKLFSSSDIEIREPSRLFKDHAQYDALIFPTPDDEIDEGFRFENQHRAIYMAHLTHPKFLHRWHTLRLYMTPLAGYPYAIPVWAGSRTS